MELSDRLLDQSWSPAFRQGWCYQAVLLKRYGLLGCLDRVAASAWVYGVSSLAPPSVAFLLTCLLSFVLHQSLELLL
jgi:hypothetical protein